MEFNLNQIVKVRLNSEGHRILEERHNDLWSAITEGNPSAQWRAYVPKETDKDGYSRFQMWELMEIFGPHISLAAKPPFGTTIIIEQS